MRITQGTFSYLPDLTDDEIAAQIQYAVSQGWAVAVEFTDVVFALDSIPAVLSITRHPFLAYTSNIMAVMGLRSLYVLLAAGLAKLRFLHFGLAAVLGFAAVKMLLADWVEIGPGVSLAVIAGMMAATEVSLSAIAMRRSGRLRCGTIIVT